MTETGSQSLGSRPISFNPSVPDLAKIQTNQVQEKPRYQVKLQNRWDGSICINWLHWNRNSISALLYRNKICWSLDNHKNQFVKVDKNSMWTYFADRKLIRIKRYKVNHQVIYRIYHPEFTRLGGRIQKSAQWSASMISIIPSSQNTDILEHICFEPRNKLLAQKQVYFVSLYIAIVKSLLERIAELF